MFAEYFVSNAVRGWRRATRLAILRMPVGLLFLLCQGAGAAAAGADAGAQENPAGSPPAVVPAATYYATLDNGNVNPRLVSDGRPITVHFNIGLSAAHNLLDATTLSEAMSASLGQPDADGKVTLRAYLTCFACDIRESPGQDLVYDTHTHTAKQVDWIISPNVKNAPGGMGDIHFIVISKDGVLDQLPARLAFDGYAGSVEDAASSCVVGSGRPSHPPDVRINAKLTAEGLKISVESRIDPLSDRIDGWARETGPARRAIEFLAGPRNGDILTKNISQMYRTISDLTDGEASAYPTNLTVQQAADANGALAYAGWRLRDEIVGRTSPLWDIFREIDAYGSERLKNKEPPLRIEIATSGVVNIPWQMFYFGERPRLETFEFRNFWGNKFILWTSPGPSSGTCGPYPSEIVRRPQNKLVYIQYHNNDSSKNDDVSELSTTYGDNLFGLKSQNGLFGDAFRSTSADELGSYIQDNGQDVIVIASFTHASTGEVLTEVRGGRVVPTEDRNGPTLQLTNEIPTKQNELLTSDKVLEWGASGDPHKPVLAARPIVFLNGCETGAIDATWSRFGPTFQDAFLQDGARAVIVTEAPLLSELGPDFGDKFFKHLVEGAQVADALYYARQEEWESNNNPLGLLYTLYGNGMAQIAPDETIPTPVAPPVAPVGPAAKP